MATGSMYRFAVTSAAVCTLRGGCSRVCGQDERTELSIWSEEGVKSAGDWCVIVVLDSDAVEDSTVVAMFAR